MICGRGVERNGQGSRNLVSAQLREIRADIRQVKAKLDKLDTKVDKLDKDNETFKYQLTHTFGLAGMANLQPQLAQEKADEALARQKRMDEQFAEIERRLTNVEEPQ